MSGTKYAGRGAKWPYFVGTLNQAANQAAQIMSTIGFAAGSTDGVRPGLAGFIEEIHAQSNADLTAGTATVVVYIEGNPTAASVVLNDTVQHVELTGLAIPYAAAARLTIRVTTDAAFAPTTADLTAQAYFRDAS